MKTIFQALRQLYPSLGLRVWTIPLLTVLGLLAAISEGFSISLIVPLLSSGSGQTHGFTAWLGGLFHGIPEDRRILVTGLFILAGILLKNLLSYGYGLYFNWINSGIGHRLRCGIIRQTLAVSQQFLDSRDSGRLLNTLGTETWRMASALSILADMLINACLVVIYGLLLIALSWKLALVSLAFFGFVSLVIHLVTARIHRLGREATSANGDFAHRMLEILSGLRLVRLFGNEAWEQERYEAASSKVRSTFFRVDSVSSLVQPLSEVLAAVFLIFVLIYAMAGQGDLAGLLVFLVVLYRLQARTKTLDSQRVALRGLSGAIEDVAAFLDPRDKPYLRSGSVRPLSLDPGIAFEDVSLRYEAAVEPALTHLDCLIRAQRTTALVGPSGAGKTTIASLICRLYDPSSGRVLVGGTDLRELDLASWRARLAVVSQDIHLFNTSVEENIRYGRRAATSGEIVEAARRAHALSFIEALPQGFQTHLGDRGLKLSGGQRQRIALARALVRDPEILILDEATNALDLEAERLVQDALEAFSTGKTVLIIAHRISTVEQADHIIVLDSGRIVEQGAPADLAAQDGAFARLRALQYREREVTDSAL